MVSRILGFLVPKFIGFKVSGFLGFKVSKIYQISISCFLIDVGPISKVFKILLYASSGCFGARLFQGFLLISLRYPGVSKDKDSWFWGSGTREQIRNHRNEEFGVLP